MPGGPDLNLNTLRSSLAMIEDTKLQMLFDVVHILLKALLPVS